MQSIGYATLANLAPQYGLCKLLKFYFYTLTLFFHLGYYNLIERYGMKWNRYERCTAADLCCNGNFARDSNWSCRSGFVVVIINGTETCRPFYWSSWLHKAYFSCNSLCWNLSNFIWTIQVKIYYNFFFQWRICVAIFMKLFGLFYNRLGFLVDFLSHAAIVGFVAGAAIVIGLQQLKGLFGITHFTTKTDIISVLKAVWEAFHNPVYYYFLYPFTFSYFSINSI